MATRQQRRRWNDSAISDMNQYAWVWGNWIKNGFRKASEIEFTFPRIHTSHGDIFCVYSSSPIVTRARKELISRLYKLSNETPPIFVDPHIFERIKAVEHG